MDDQTDRYAYTCAHKNPLFDGDIVTGYLKITSENEVVQSLQILRSGEYIKMDAKLYRSNRIGRLWEGDKTFSDDRYTQIEVSAEEFEAIWRLAESSNDFDVTDRKY